MEFMCALGKTLFYIIYITGVVELPNINIQFYSNKFFCISWNKGASDHDSFNLFNKYTGLEAARGGQAFNKYKCCEIVSRHLSLTQYWWLSSSFNPKLLFLHTTASISPFSNRSESITISFKTCLQTQRRQLAFLRHWNSYTGTHQLHLDQPILSTFLRVLLFWLFVS